MSMRTTCGGVLSQSTWVPMKLTPSCGSSGSRCTMGPLTSKTITTRFGQPSALLCALFVLSKSALAPGLAAALPNVSEPLKHACCSMHLQPDAEGCSFCAAESQAFVYKHYGQRNARQFAPHTLRQAVPGERAGPIAGGFLQLEGLGKIAYSNVRRPKPLMDVSTEAAEVLLSVGQAVMHVAVAGSSIYFQGPVMKGLSETRDQSGLWHLQGSQEEGVEAPDGVGPRQAQRPLEQEPLLAARIMIEDCLNLLLDVEDIDRLYTAGLPGGWLFHA